MSETRIILCDLGRTLIDFDHKQGAANIVKFLRETKRVPKSILPLELRLFSFLFGTTPGKDSRNARLERGQMSIDELAAEFSEAFDVSLVASEISPLWNEMFSGMHEQVFAAMRRARAKGIRVAICSNTNASHWEYLLGGYPALRELSEAPFLSFELGKTKTDAGFFEEIVKRTGTAPSAHLFLDDLEENLAAARKVGIETLHYTGALPEHAAWS